VGEIEGGGFGIGMVIYFISNNIYIYIIVNVKFIFLKIIINYNV